MSRFGTLTLSCFRRCAGRPVQEFDDTVADEVRERRLFDEIVTASASVDFGGMPIEPPLSRDDIRRHPASPTARVYR